MQTFGEGLGAMGSVTFLDYPYQLEGRRAPDRLPVLVAAHQAALVRARLDYSGPIVLAGKSMGGRVGCHVALEASPKPNALVCFGYPLVGQNGAVRDKVLLELETPILFVQGTRDSLCPLDRLESVRSRMRVPNELFVIEGGDHSLKATRAALEAKGCTQEALNADILACARAFLSRWTAT